MSKIWESQKPGYRGYKGPNKPKLINPTHLLKQVVEFIKKRNVEKSENHFAKELYSELTKNLSEIQIFSTMPGFNEVPCCTIKFSLKIGSTGRNIVTVHKLASCSLPAALCKEFKLEFFEEPKLEPIIKDTPKVHPANIPRKKTSRPKLSKEERMKKKKWFCSLPEPTQKTILASIPDPRLKIKKLVTLTPLRIHYYLRKINSGDIKNMSRFCPFCGEQNKVFYTCIGESDKFYRCDVCKKKWNEEIAVVNIKEHS